MIYQVETNQSTNRKDIPYGTVVTPALPSWEAALEAAKQFRAARDAEWKAQVEAIDSFFDRFGVRLIRPRAGTAGTNWGRHWPWIVSAVAREDRQSGSTAAPLRRYEIAASKQE
jgi:hypothetical protein